MARPLAHSASIHRVIADAAGPLSADEIREQLRATGVGIATVYRALKSGVEEGSLAVVELPNEPARYEPSARPHHHHFSCDVCGRVFDVEGCPGDLDDMVPEGFTLKRHEVLLFGVCRGCGVSS